MLKDLLKKEGEIGMDVIKNTVRDINLAIDKFKEEKGIDLPKIRVVGTKKRVLLEQWHKTVEVMDEAGFNVPSSSMEFWNEYCPEIEDSEEEVQEEEEVEEEEEEVEEEEVTEEEKPKLPKANKEPKAKKEPESKKEKPAGLIPRKITSFEELKKSLENPKTPTSYMDYLTLKGGNIEELLAEFKQYLADNNIEFKSFKNVSQLNTHILYRMGKGWVYQKEDNEIKLVGFSEGK